MTLDENSAIMIEAQNVIHDIARVHTDIPMIFDPTAEQVHQLIQPRIEHGIIPEVNPFTATAPAIGKELTLPELSQTIILTRVGTHADTREELIGRSHHTSGCAHSFPKHCSLEASRSNLSRIIWKRLPRSPSTQGFIPDQVIVSA
jgi:precorrin-4 methylase